MPAIETERTFVYLSSSLTLNSNRACLVSTTSTTWSRLISDARIRIWVKLDKTKARMNLFIVSTLIPLSSLLPLPPPSFSVWVIILLCPDGWRASSLSDEGTDSSCQRPGSHRSTRTNILESTTSNYSPLMFRRLMYVLRRQVQIENCSIDVFS